MQDNAQPSPAGSPAASDQHIDPKANEQVEYWRGVAQKYREKAAAFDDYEPIISHLNENPQHVDDFKRIVSGEAQLIAVAEGMADSYRDRPRKKSEEEQLAEDLGLDDDDQPKPRKAQQAPRGNAEEEARRLGALQERARIEFKLFEDSLKSDGVGEHMLDEYQEWLRNPNGISHYDLFAAWASNKSRSSGQNPLKTVLGLIPSPTSASGGSAAGERPVVPATNIPGGKSNRPDARLYTDSSDRHDKWVPNPASI